MKPVGVSLLAVDPGETTGWAWCCVGFKEIRHSGVNGALTRAARHKSGTQLCDTRFECGEVSMLKHIETVLDEMRRSKRMKRSEVRASTVPRWKCELLSAEDLVVEALRLDSLTRRVSPLSGLNLIVIEDFVLRERTKDRSLLSPVRLTGHIQALLYKSTLDSSIELQPSSAKGVITDDRLKDAGFWQKGKPHANDAIRHLMIRLRSITEGL